MTTPREVIPETAVELVDAISLRGDLVEEVLSADGPLPKRDLLDRVTVSRSTVDRGLRRLVNVGLLRRTSDGYAVTTSGRLVYAEHEAYVERLATIAGTQDLIDLVPPDAPLRVGFLSAAETVTADPPATHAPSTRIGDVIEGADRIEGMAKVYSTPEATDRFRSELDRGMALDLVLDRDMFEHLVDTFDWVEDYLATDRFTARVHDAVPYGLFVVEDGDATDACLVVYDGDDQIAGVFVADGDSPVSWAREVVKQYRAEATVSIGE